MAAKRSGAGSKRPQRTGVSPQPVPEPRGEPPLSAGPHRGDRGGAAGCAGVDGLTMRRLADRLGAGVMSLYWHVGNKEDVFDLALDSVLDYRAPPQPGEPQDWRGDVVHMLEDWRASMLRHPWSASLLPRRALGPNILGRLELLEPDLVQGRRGGCRSERRDLVALELRDGRHHHPGELRPLGRRQGRRAAAPCRSRRTHSDDRTHAPAAGQ